jgi:hypothetical protein
MSNKILTTSQKNDKINTLRFVLSKKLQEIMSLQNILKQDVPESEKYAAQIAIDILTPEFHSITEKINELSQDSKEKDDSKESVFIPLSYFDLLSLPPKEWLLDQVFGLGDLGMVFGPPGCGKTFVVIDMIIQMCKGKQWAERFDLSRPLNVAYCAGEGISALPSRFKAALKHHKAENLTNFTFYKTIPQFYDKESFDYSTILQFILEWKIRQQKNEAEPLDVLVIDTLHTAISGGDENSSQDMGVVLQACRMVTQQLGCTVILVHHTNKDGITERGSSSLRGAMDFMIRIKRPDLGTGNDATMICEKLKDGELWREQGFYLSKVEDTHSVRVAWDDPLQGEMSYGNSQAGDRERLIKAMKQQNGNGLSSKQLSEVIGKTQQQTNKLLSKLVEEKACDRTLKDPKKNTSNLNPWVYSILVF